MFPLFLIMRPAEQILQTMYNKFLHWMTNGNKQNYDAKRWFVLPAVWFKMSHLSWHIDWPNDSLLSALHWHYAVQLLFWFLIYLLQQPLIKTRANNNEIQLRLKNEVCMYPKEPYICHYNTTPCYELLQIIKII